MKFRFLNMLYAHLNGFFWLACPICGNMFGGHECADESLLDTPSTGRGVCKDCEIEAHKKNKILLSNYGIKRG